MKKLLLLIILFSLNQSYGQDSMTEKLMIAGNEAYQNSNFEAAKKNYESILRIDPTNKDALFNLAGTELNIGNITQACILLQKSYSLGDFGAYELIMQYCNGLEYAEKMFLFHVDELPKFKFKTDFEPLIVNKKQISPQYMELLKSEIKKSKELKGVRGKIYIILNVDINGELSTKINGNISDEAKTALVNVLKNMTEYKPAIYRETNVGLFGGGFTLPLNL